MGPAPLSLPQIPQLPVRRHTLIVADQGRLCYLLFWLCKKNYNCRSLTAARSTASTVSLPAVWPSISYALFTFPLCKFFENEVQFSVGFLTRPVTADQSCYDARHNKYTDDYDSSLYHASVPCMLPRTRAIMIADMNMPAMMCTKSM